MILFMTVTTMMTTDATPVGQKEIVVQAGEAVSLPLLKKYEEQIPTPSNDDDQSIIEKNKNKNGDEVFPQLNSAKKTCTPEVTALVTTFAETLQGRKAACPEVLEAVKAGQQPVLADACQCTFGIVEAVNEDYDDRFNCVIGPSKNVWNIRLTHRYCKLRHMAVEEAKAGGPATLVPAAIIDGTNTLKCTETSCVRGTCTVSASRGLHCECPTGFAGSRCEREACPNDCSGFGICDLAAGKCRCQSTHEGIDCGTVHEATKQTEHGRVIPGVQDDSNQVKIIGKCLEEYAKIQKKITKTKDVFLHVPRCHDNGLYYKRQCHRYTYDCWCVTEVEGKEVHNSRRAPGYTPPDCDSFKSMEKNKFNLNPIPEPDHDECSRAGRYCFEGFCNSEASGGPQCQCVNGYTGEFCDSPPETPVNWDLMANRTLPPGQE